MPDAAIPEHTDYPTLTLGHHATSCSVVHIVGLEVHVYGLEEIKGSSLPIAAVIATHGRCNNAKQMAHFAHGVLGHISAHSAGKPKKRDVVVITVDQRNHGKRVVNKTANLAYDQNPNHLFDMTACVCAFSGPRLSTAFREYYTFMLTAVGGCQDVTLIMDFLGSYLFPHGERTIDEWVATGISLGGNLTWRLLQLEPRIQIAIPIIGLPWPTFPKYLRARAVNMGLKWEPPLYPPSLKSILEVPRPDGAFAGKKILTIHGGEDTLVPFSQGKDDIEGIKREVEGSGGEMEVWIKDGAGHVVTTDMVERVGEWVWRYALAAA